MLTISRESPITVVSKPRAIHVLEQLIALVEASVNDLAECSFGAQSDNEPALIRYKSTLEQLLSSPEESASIPTLWIVIAEATENRTEYFGRNREGGPRVVVESD